jgi:threonine dehydrogenase-like Zn-dependent dehydrogenase
VAAGASEVLVSEPNPRRRNHIREVGGKSVEPESVSEAVAEKVFECVGRPETMRAAVEAAKPGGTVVWVGVAPPEAEVSIRPYNVFRRELTIRGTYTNPFTMGRSLALLASGRIDWKSIITHRIPIARFEEAWETHREGTGLKVCVFPGDG